MYGFLTHTNYGIIPKTETTYFYKRDDFYLRNNNNSLLGMKYP
jgi:hypothetical protein